MQNFLSSSIRSYLEQREPKKLGRSVVSRYRFPTRPERAPQSIREIERQAQDMKMFEIMRDFDHQLADGAASNIVAGDILPHAHSNAIHEERGARLHASG